MKKVTIYSAPTCHYCHMAKDYFKSKGIEYQEYDVAADVEKRQEMLTKSGQMGVPVIVIGEDLIVGFDEAAVAHLLDN